ncbi:MAG: FAD-dependent monooxygenase [Acidobacteriota bacterium]|nr:MAG: FAD-dependent monooxygenase [Acidobacteriota bacterium]
MFKSQKTDVLVVGAGPVGLFTALLLVEQGVKVEVIEEQWRSATRSYALALHPRSLSLFSSLGFAKELVSQGNCVDRLGLYDYRLRRKELQFRNLPVDFPFVAVVPQQALEEVLIGELQKRKVPVHWNHRLAHFKQDEEGVEVEVERLTKESTGYSVTRTEWVVDKTIHGRVGFIVGADGHRSTVRKQSGIEFPELGSSAVFEVFEFLTDSPSGDELQVVIDQDRLSVLWPMTGGRCRWSFERDPKEVTQDPRAKSRLLVQFRDEAYPHVTDERLSQLIKERAPWFEATPTEVVWSAAIRFERRLAEHFGEGRVWLIGDAAHVALPIAIQSMNVGLREAQSLSSAIAAVLAGHSGLEFLNDHQSRWQAEWQRLIGLTEHPKIPDGTDPWVAKRAGLISACIPASGKELDLLLAQAFA